MPKPPPLFKQDRRVAPIGFVSGSSVNHKSLQIAAAQYDMSKYDSGIYDGVTFCLYNSGNYDSEVYK